MTPALTTVPTVTPLPQPSGLVSPGPSFDPLRPFDRLRSPDPSPSPFPSQEPALVGSFLCLDLATARLQLDEIGLLVGATIPEEPDEDWIIHDQLPSPGETVPIGSAIDLVLMDRAEPCPAG